LHRVEVARWVDVATQQHEAGREEVVETDGATAKAHAPLRAQSARGDVIRAQQRRGLHHGLGHLLLATSAGAAHLRVTRARGFRFSHADDAAQVDCELHQRTGVRPPPGAAAVQQAVVSLEVRASAEGSGVAPVDAVRCSLA
jgi:hypothetical protein